MPGTPHPLSSIPTSSPSGSPTLPSPIPSPSPSPTLPASSSSNRIVNEATPPPSQPATTLGPSAPSSSTGAGLKGMAKAARKGMTGQLEGGGGTDGTGEGLGIGEGKGEGEEEHPLSEGKLEERGYHSFMCLGRPFNVEKRWKLVRELGQGAYGLVVSAQDEISGETIAIKMITRVFDKVILARRALREITLLRHFASHENITGLIDLDIVHPGYNEIYMFIEPMEADLHQIIRSGQQLSNSHVQYFMYQLLRGMKYIHSANVLHRDIKPGNVLVNADCELKICDFGLARGFHPDGLGGDLGAPLTEYVATRWYRAPEIMLSFRRYTTGIDIWSIGCILAELLGGKPVFKGKDYVDQLNLILNVLGTPDDENLSRVGSEKACKYIRSLPIMEPVPFSKLYPNADADGLDLLSKLLTFDPAKRIPVTAALAHPYLAAYHDEADEPSCPAIFDKWEEVEGLEDIADFRASIAREVGEFRAEVRAVDEIEPPWDEEGGVGAEGEEEEVHEREGEHGEEHGEEEEGQGSWHESTSGVDGLPASSSSSPFAPPREGSEGDAALPPHYLPNHRSQSHSRRQSHHLSPHSHPIPLSTPDPDSSSQPTPTGPPPRDSSRPPRTPRRPSSGFFDPSFVGGSHPHRRPNSLVFTPSPAASTNPSPSGGHPPATHSSELVRPARSRQHSTSGTDAFRPLLRSLSTVSVGGFPGLGGFSKMDAPPPISPGAKDGGEGEKIPREVSPSDAPASEMPLEFRCSAKERRERDAGEVVEAKVVEAQ